MDRNGYEQNWPSDSGESAAKWHVLWARSNCERIIYKQLQAKGYDVFLPTMTKWSTNKRKRVLYQAPLFPGYLFIRHAIDKFSYIDISKAQGLVKILGERWDKLATVPDSEIEPIITIQESDSPRMPYTYLRQGDAVRVTDGPLANIEGIFVKSDATKGVLVLSIQLLSRSVAVNVDCSRVVPV